MTESEAQRLQGYAAIPLRGPAGRAAVALHGAHVLSWQDGAGRERLYLSSSSVPVDDGATGMGAAIRGGIPVCFPQFAGRGGVQKHGFARNLRWERAERSEDRASFLLHDSALTREAWPFAFEARLEVTLGSALLDVSLSVLNRGDRPFEFTTALHTYLRVDDIRQSTLDGLQGTRFEDATQNNALSTQQEELLEIGAEVDRVYLAPPRRLVLHESGRPTLEITQHGFADTVVWNPGPDKARALNDMPDADWLRMLCVEAAAIETPIRLEPGASWQGRQVLSALA